MVVTPQRAGLLEQVSQSIYSLSMQDTSARIAEINASYGLARMRSVLRRRGVDDNGVVCVFSPDGGITRNKERWAAGFGYGCLIRWPGAAEAGRAFAFPQLRPNACGTLVVRLSQVPRIEQLWERLEAAKGKELTLEGSKLKLNLGVSNHFIEVCTVTSSSLGGLHAGDPIAVVHTSPNELKDELYDLSLWEAKGGAWDETPFGPIFVLEGPAAEEYFRTYEEIDRFSAKKRLHLAHVMFGEFDEVSNETHQGLFAQNVAGLGVYRTGGAAVATNGAAKVFPLTLRHDLPIYLLRGRPNLRPEVMVAEGLAGRAADNGHTRILESANILPHGAGYKLLVEPDRIRVSEDGLKRYFHLSTTRSELVVSEPRELPYDYRGAEVLRRIQELQLGEVAATAEQIYTLKY